MLLCIVFLSAVITAHATICPAKYERYSLDHTYCLPGCCRCSFYYRGVSDYLKNFILFQYNSFRNKVAGGKSYGVSHLPRAANMLEMVWDDELADLAQKWVDNCKRSNDCNLCRMVDRFAVGQTRVEFEGSIMTDTDYEMEFFSYFNLLKDLKKEDITRYTDSSENGGITQLLWAKTWRIGCGFLYFSSDGRTFSDLVCNYGPRGNIEGEEVYKEGSACSACPANTCCGDDCKKYGIMASYDGLCKVIDENLPPEGKVPHNKTDKEIFYCGFNGESDCSYTVEGTDRWVSNISTGGTWISTYLESGGHTTLTFGKSIISTAGKLCLSIVTRTGPTVADDEYRYKLSGVLKEDGTYMTTLVFPEPDEKVKHRFHTDYFKADYFPENRDVKFILRFEVPNNTQSQYIEIKRIVVEEKDCPKQTIGEGSGFSSD